MMCASSVCLLTGSLYYTLRLSTSDFTPLPHSQAQVRGKDKALMENVANLDEEETDQVGCVRQPGFDRTSLNMRSH